MTLYATGARRAEATHLKVSDIYSQRMIVHIREGINPDKRRCRLDCFWNDDKIAEALVDTDCSSNVGKTTGI